MTSPNDPRWSENPQPGQGGWQPPQYGQPEHGPQYGPAPQYGPDELLGPQQPQRPRGRGKAMAVAAAAVVLLGGGVATYAAVSATSGAGGSATPNQAVQKLFADLGRSDLIGMLDDLPPAERVAIAKPVQDTITELQHEGIIAPNANLNHVSGVQITPTNLTFAPNTITINDHVQVVRLTGGTITFDGDAAKLPLAGSLLRQIEANAGPTTVHRTVNIAQAIRRAGQPIRIATQKVDGRWYPSLLYTIADNATTAHGLGTPNLGAAIPARGASSADAAVRQMLTDLLAGRVEQAIELTSPDEDAVLHDYGKYIVDRVHYRPAPVRINSISFTDSAISGGTQVSLKSIDVTVRGQRVSVMRQGNCVEFRGMGQDQRLCRRDIARIAEANGVPGNVADGLMSGSAKSGIVTTQSGGKWYVNPVRTVMNLGPQLVPLFGAAMHAGTGMSVGSAHGSGWPALLPAPAPTHTR